MVHSEPKASLYHEVDAALGDVTERIRATPFRPQNKAHCEGAFGLFLTPHMMGGHPEFVAVW